MKFLVRHRSGSHTFEVGPGRYSRSAAHESASDCAARYPYAELWRVEGGEEVLLATYRPFVMPAKYREVA